MTGLTEERIVALPEGAKAAGAIVFWNMSGTTDASLLAQAWRDFGLPEDWLLELPTPEVALRRAVREQGEKHRLVRSLKNGGWAIVREKQSDDDLDYGTEMKVSLSATGQLKFVGGGEGTQDEVRAAFRTHLDNLSREDIGGWLADLVPKLDAVSMRGSGGVYFIPPASVPRWEAIKDAVSEASNTKLYEVPALQAKAAVEAILDAITAEAQEAADAVLAEIQVNAAETAMVESNGLGKSADGAQAAAVLGSRALENRARQLEAVRLKVERYEQLLGQKLTGLQDKLSEVRASAAAAAMAAHAREQTEAGE